MAREKGFAEVSKFIEDFPANERKRLIGEVCKAFGSRDSVTPICVPSELVAEWMSNCAKLLNQVNRNTSDIPPEDLIKKGGADAELSFLGQGAYGKVYEGKLYNTTTRKDLFLAVKVTSSELQMPSSSSDTNKVSAADLESSVHKEILVLSTFRHPNIIKLLAYSWKLPRMYLVFELAGGGSLERYLKEDSLAGKLSWANRVAIARGVVSALQYMHSGDHGKRAVAFHRDLKAANVVLSAFSAGETPTPKLIDCGLAKFIPTRDSKATVLTSGVGKVWGTRGYVCPQYQHCPDGGYSSQNEVFSLGVLLAELFTGSLQNQSHTHHSKKSMSDAKLSPPDRRAGALPGPVGTFALVCTYATPVRRRVFLQPLESNDNSSYRSGSARVGGPLPEYGT